MYNDNSLRPFRTTLISSMMLVLLGWAFTALAGVSVSLTGPVNGSTVGSPLHIEANATASGGYTISKVEFFQDSTLIGTDTSFPYDIWHSVQPGSYALTAKATAIKSNSPNQTATSSPVNITVTSSPVVTLISPTETQFAHPATITLTATATDSDGTIAWVEFITYGAYGESENFRITEPPYTFVWQPWPMFENWPYVYEIYVEARDNHGALGYAGTTIYITENTPPTVSLSNPPANATFTAPANIAIQAQAADSDGTVSSVELYHGTTLITTLTSAPYSFIWTGVPQGTYTLTAKAKDNLNAVTTSTPVNVTVTQAAATLHFIHADHLNTPRLVANQSGQTVWRWDQQEPFGINVADENPSGSGTFEFPLRFPGQYADKETNLHYNYFRDYDPGIGRYIESDPIGLRGGLNTYAYVNNKPVSSIDPMGLKARICCRKIRGLPASHCFIQEQLDSTCGPCKSRNRTIGLHGPAPWGNSKYADAGEIRTGDRFDDPDRSDCGDWNEDCGVGDCIDIERSYYPSPSVYNAIFGPNSNTFAGTIARACKLQQPSDAWWTRGWNDQPARPKMD